MCVYLYIYIYIERDVGEYVYNIYIYIYSHACVLTKSTGSSIELRVLEPAGLEQMRETCSFYPALETCQESFMVPSYVVTTKKCVL